ncbi:hypothetical protein C1645_800768 [Glomus cerebriforme]|uniref:Uncharacterized protein n=1 Tax=Glomus cerebriforme TaxID=658196 RepID=A0A397TMT9_9GLOM|nr:hypothetical protein C1645_800768 [Glomus cerebriforme]
MNPTKMSQLQERIKTQLQETYKNKFRLAAIIFVFLSMIFFLTMLIGSAVGTVDLNTFTFKEPISTILQRKSIKFTLLGYCIDDKCTKDVSHNFDKAPTSNEIQSGEINKRGIDINPSGVVGSVGDAANKAANGVGDAANKAANGVGDAANSAGDVAKNAGDTLNSVANDLARKAVNTLLSAFDSFVPKEPTNVFDVIGAIPGIGDNKTGPAMSLSGWSSVFLLIAISLIIIDGSRRKKNVVEEKKILNNSDA